MKYIHKPQLTAKPSPEPVIHETCHIIDSYLGEWTSIGSNSQLVETLMGDHTYAMDDVTINYAEIGKFTSIASHVCINPVQHPMNRVTQHHMTYRRKAYDFSDTDDQDIFNWRRTHRVTIGHDVWIGHGAIIMKGVTIGTGAVIGSGSVVTKDVAPYTIVVGVPAKPIKSRFQHDVIEKLLQIAWWDWSREMLEERFYELNDLHTFIDKYGSDKK